MDLVKSWLGQALRATGAAVVVPVAILVALSVGALGGTGLGGLGALSQIVSGPQVAGSGVEVDDGDTEITDAVAQLGGGGADPATPGSAGDGGAGGGIGGPGAGGGGGGGPVGGGPPSAGPGPGGGVNPPAGGGPPGGGNGGGGGGGGGGTPPTDTPPPTAVEEVGNEVKDVTSDTPVAPTVEDAVDTLVETCRQLDCP